MPTPREPPKAPLDSSTVTALAGSAYDSQTQGFTYQGTDYLMTVQRQASASSCAEWIHATTSEAGVNNNPQAKMSNATWEVLRYGQYDSQGATYSYKNDTWEIRMEESGGDLYAVAVKT